MATYKVIQDIEAEDHILGPLTLRQFIFGLIAIFLFYICSILVVKHVAFLLVLFLPPALFFGFFALPFGRDQPTEVWALAKLRYWFLPRSRIWNQSGVKELVTITVPKKVERVLTNGLSQTEVKSRLQALANTIDSRGWAVKNVDVNAYTVHQPITGGDRLIDIATMPQEVSNSEMLASDDILDAGNNPIARQFDSMITQTSQARRQLLVEQLNAPAALLATPVVLPPTQPVPIQVNPTAPPPDYWFMGQGSTVAIPPPITTPAVKAADRYNEAQMAWKLKAQASAKGTSSYGNMRTIQPLGSLPATPVTPVAPAVTPSPDPAILNLSQNNDLNVATLAREARKNGSNGDLSDEVVISLH